MRAAEGVVAIETARGAENGDEMTKKIVNRRDGHAYFVGGGIASLAGAAYLIRDAGFPAERIHILEELAIAGGSLDGSGTPESGYVLRGGRMLNFTYGCTYDLFESIPSLDGPEKTVYDEIVAFNQQYKSHSKSRVREAGQSVELTSMGFSHSDRLALIEVMARSEAHWGDQRIDQQFSPHFFTTNFWFMWATMFAFQPWHSLVEFKRYLHRFIHEFPRIDTLAGIDRTPYNQYDSLVRPLEKWLKQQGVQIELDCRVVDADFRFGDGIKSVERLAIVRHGEPGEIAIGAADLVFFTVGSMTEGSALGSMTAAPALRDKGEGGAWTLWERLAEKDRAFGNPWTFDERIGESKWESFTLTFRDPTFFQLMEKLTGNVAGSGGLVTFKDSGWLMSVVLAHQPHFIGQPDGVSVAWGYALFPDRPGDYVKKKMSECTGAEILVELCRHLRFDEQLPRILETATCIPCMMPFITSQFLTRKPGDRPAVVPEGATNFAFLGQFCELPDDVVFTVEYSVRSAQVAVYSLLDVDREVIPMYRGDRDIRVLFDAVQTMLR
jgi:oleate hydratase